MLKLSRHSNQAGIVSILVSIIIMIVISLIVIGFATIIRREQRQAVDRQLSTQAFYAAESGINDAISTIKTDINNGVTTQPKTTCPPDNHYSANSTLDSSSLISYSCLLVDQAPTSLEYGSVNIDHSTVVPVINQNNTAINSIKISWQDTSGNTSLSGCPANVFNPFVPNANWSASCNAGVLRIDLVPNTSFSRAGLTAATLTAFFVPWSASAPGTLSYPNQGAIVPANCSAGNSPKICSVTINGLSATGYYLRARSIYKSNSLSVSAYAGGANPLHLANAQAVIDSTGKASDVLRRIVVRVPLNNFNGPEFAIQSSDSICKKLQVGVNFAQVDSTVTDAACQIPTNLSL